MAVPLGEEQRGCFEVGDAFGHGFQQVLGFVDVVGDDVALPGPDSGGEAGDECGFAECGHAAAVEGVAVEVLEGDCGDDGGQVRRLFGGGHELGDAVAGSAEHADLAGGPRLVGQPLDDVVAGASDAALVELEVALGTAGAG